MTAITATEVHARDLVAAAVKAAALATETLAAANRAVEAAAGAIITELSEAQAAYYAADHDDELWAVIEALEATLAPFDELADTLEDLAGR